MIDFLPSQFLKSQSTLDELSVTEIEHLIEKSTFNQNYRILLAKKMSQSMTHDLALRNTDHTMRVFGLGNAKVPRFEDIMMIDDEKNQNSLSIIEETLMEKVEHMATDIPKTIDTSADHYILSIERKDQSIISAELLNVELIEKEDFEVSNVDNNYEVELMNEESTLSTVESTDDKELDDVDKEKVVSSSDDENIQILKKKKKKKKKKKGFRLEEFAGITSYSKWLLSFKRNDIEKKIAKELKENKKRELTQIANKSITKSKSLVSEPLADLLVQQGHFDEAKKMYEQLMHKNPEKSRYFAAKIENLLKT